MNSKDGQDKVDVFMTNCTYRRTEDDLFLGNKMMNLPPKHMVDQTVTLTAVERTIQRWLDGIFGNKEVKTAGEPCAGSQRYIQLLSHPYALESFLRDDGDYGVTIEQLEDLLKAIREVEQSATHTTAEQIGNWTQRQVSNDASLLPLGELKVLDPFSKSFGKSVFGVRCYPMAPLIALTIANRRVRDSKCEDCQGNIDEPQVAEEAEFDKREQAIDASQKVTKKRKRLQGTKAQARGGRRTSQVPEPAQEHPRERRLGEDARGMRPSFDQGDGAFMKIASLENGGIPAAGSKLTAVKDTLLRWQKAHPDDKCIIFVQFIKTLFMTGIMLQLEHIGFVYTYGKMSKDRKADAKATFESDPNVKVLVATMGTCSEGLNLTCANRVIVVDAWWNNAREKQSFGRVIRTGQTKETHCVRIKAHDSIDDKIEEIQVNKSSEVDFVVQDDEHEPFALSELGVFNLLNPEKYLELCIETVSEIRGIEIPDQEGEEDENSDVAHTSEVEESSEVESEYAYQATVGSESGDEISE
ncbi:hypothetical protein ACHAQA_007220 [Verticillium albo-atrum]